MFHSISKFILDNYKKSKLLTCETFPTIKQVLVKLRPCQHTDKNGKTSSFFPQRQIKGSHLHQ